MKLQPEYAQHIIVAVRYRQTFYWFVTEKDWWYLDWVQLEQAYLKQGYSLPHPGTYNERFHIGVLDETTVDGFLQNIADYEVKSAELQQYLLNLKGSEHQERQLSEDFSFVTECAPSLFVDFDAKMLLSSFPEPASFENLVPHGWEGRYEDVLQHIPVSEQYWIHQGRNYFQ
ncbi:hypothetical protein [Paenibacillus kandeliae]|uniref:hypothetical protein n=1 Tax=Paenibacillus kandeliae TaxID=3231269 RepID=UPI003459E849